MIITRSYLMNNRTTRGAWTRAQVEALGVEYPPLRGWLKGVIGKPLSSDAAKLFELGSTKYATKSNLSAVKKRLCGLTDGELIELKLHLDRVINKIKDTK